MTIPSILRAFRPTTLQVLCAVGMFHGISMFVYAIRERRRLLARSEAPIIKKPIPNREAIFEQSTRLRVGSVRVIQLSPDKRKMKVSDMTQQQKIAAALLKAGASNPAAWNDPDLYDADAASTVQVMPPSASTSTDDDGATCSYIHGAAMSQPRWKTDLVLWIGAALTFLSLYFLLKSVRWLP